MLLAGACSDTDDTPDIPDGTLGRPVNTVFSIRTASSAADNNELINTWWVAFIAPDNHIEKIISHSPTAPTSEDSYELTLPAGKYTVVGFANAVPSVNADGAWVYTNGNQEIFFAEGEQSPVTFDNAPDFRFDDPSPESWGVSPLIPMSALQKVEVTGKHDETIFIEMARLVAKIELSFENIGKRDISINSVRFERFKSNAVTLFPDYSSLDNLPVIPSGASMLDVTRSYSPIVLSPDASASDIFYSRESSAASLPNGVYTLFLNVTHHAGLGWNETTDEVSVLLSDIAYVNRNDHIVIPLKISDYIIGIDVNFYPPIGGYPAVLTDAGNGNYYAKFGSMGVFTIRPTVRKAVALDDPDFGELSNAFLNMEIVSVTGDDIFIRPPMLDENHDIIGQIGANKGSAKVTLRFKMPQTDGSVLNYYRTVLIIRE